MIIVPLKNDKIETKDGDNFVVETYTNLKSEPAVYIVADSGDNLIYFKDIEKIDGVKVELKGSDKVFNSLGHVKRKVNLPQPKDILILEGDLENKEIKSLKLHNKKEGINRGLLVCTEDGCFELTDIVDIEGSITFNKNTFLKEYEDYLPSNFKSK